MRKQELAIIFLLAFFVGGLGSLVLGRVLIPYLASIHGLESLNKLVSSAPIVITRTQEVQLNEGVNLIDLVKQAGNITVTITDAAGNFLCNGLIVSSDGLIFSSNAVLGKQVSVGAVTNDGQKYPAEIKFRDAKTDVAVLKITASNLSAVQFDSAANLETAQRVIFLGRSNIKQEHEAVAGLVTLNLRNQLGTTKQIFSDAQVGSNYFGGPIINLSGHVIGLTLAQDKNVIAEDLQTLLTNYLAQSKPTQ